jgi:hypothetical protein
MAGNHWTVRGTKFGLERTLPLELVWEANLSSGPYDEDMHGVEAWQTWLRMLAKSDYDESVDIWWFVSSPDGGFFEGAPFNPHADTDDFLTHFTWPEDENGNRLRWTDLPVIDGKSSWIYELTGWRPAPLTAFMPVKVIAQACDLPPLRSA